MKLHEIKLLAAAVSLVAIATTVALASTMHTHATSARQAQGAGSKAAGSSSGQNGSPRHGILTCGADSTATACEQLEMMLPMTVRRWADPLKRPTNI
jgi:hypothetical protein